MSLLSTLYLMILLLQVPFTSQHYEDWWKGSDCGPAAAAMVVEYYQHRKVEAYEFSVDMGIEKRDDSYRRIEEIGEWVRMQGVWVVYKDRGNWSVEEARERVSQGSPVIALINHPLIGHHYIVIIGITKSMVYMHDPWFGPVVGIQRDTFDLMWIWMIVPEEEPDDQDNDRTYSPRHWKATTLRNDGDWKRGHERDAF